MYTQPVPVATVAISAGDVNQLKEMFPDVPQTEIERVLAANNGVLDAAIIALLN